MSPRTLIHTLYPRLLALHDLENDVAVPVHVSGEHGDGDGELVLRMPSCMRDAYHFMEGHGVYLIGGLLHSRLSVRSSCE